MPLRCGPLSPHAHLSVSSSATRHCMLHCMTTIAHTCSASHLGYPLNSHLSGAQSDRLSVLEWPWLARRLAMSGWVLGNSIWMVLLWGGELDVEMVPGMRARLRQDFQPYISSMLEFQESPLLFLFLSHLVLWPSHLHCA
jgi:hypothetical protein